jgi:hypothetical protein
MAVEAEQAHNLPRADMVVTVWVATTAETHTVADLLEAVVVEAAATA